MSRLGPLGWQWPRNEGNTLLGWSPSGRELRNYPIADILATPHTHTITNVTGLQAALDGKAATSHTHLVSDVSGLQAALDGKAAVSHSHSIADVTGLQTALDRFIAEQGGNLTRAGAIRLIVARYLGLKPDREQ
ncbi:hypothetical protein [Aestuariivirga sp.]|jgi:hypothetical protein|uniref:hypothetical protein n=1 Tax=Aestuariivirga sp. TaxID=2650926 RepID=UPI00378529F1